MPALRPITDVGRLSQSSNRNDLTRQRHGGIEAGYYAAAEANDAYRYVVREKLN
jgi:hypothetical protein